MIWPGKYAGFWYTTRWEKIVLCSSHPINELLVICSIVVGLVRYARDTETTTNDNFLAMKVPGTSTREKVHHIQKFKYHFNIVYNEFSWPTIFQRINERVVIPPVVNDDIIIIFLFFLLPFWPANFWPDNKFPYAKIRNVDKQMKNIW